jgi:hypothetical protein
MKIVSRILLCLFLTVVGHGALAQTRLTVSQALDFWISNTEKRLFPLPMPCRRRNICSHQVRVSSLAPALSPSK